MRPPAGVRFAHAAYSVVLPTRGSAAIVTKLSVRKLEPGIAASRSNTVPMALGRVQLLPPSRDTTRTCDGHCAKAMYAVPSGPTSIDEPCRPLPVPLFEAGDSWLGLPKLTPPSADVDTIIGSFPKPVTVFERNSVQLK